MPNMPAEPLFLDEAVDDSLLVERARAYATGAHAAVGQRHKREQFPYAVHLRSVAELVADARGMVAAAWLHDVVENTACTVDGLRTVFGDPVATYVDWLTDPSKNNDAGAKSKEHARLASAPTEVKTIKLADLIDNCGTVLQYKPEIVDEYLADKEQVIHLVADGNGPLYEKAMSIIERWKTLSATKSTARPRQPGQTSRL
jgi:(p)ppGpp synthase/HD superfamily hydrolase